MVSAVRPALAWHRLDLVHRRRWLLLLIAVAGGAGCWYWTLESIALESSAGRVPVATITAPPPPPTLQVEVVQPQSGGLPRLTVQTGTVEPYASADLYAKVSGYVKSVAVDLGDVVSQGQLVAEIDAPELQKDVDSATAKVEQSRVQVLQAEARLKAAQAQHRAAEAAVTRAAAEIRRAAAQRAYHETEFARIEQLAASGSVQTKLVDEVRQRLESARAEEDHAHASAAVTEAELQAVAARVGQARADVAVAEADVRVATAALEQARVMFEYTRIRAPHDGVITRRNYDTGDFIRSAVSGGVEPLLTVALVDRMRVVVQVPDSDVPFVRPGHPAEVRIDTLGGEVFTGTVSRISCAQDRRTRTMRAEIDLPNPERRLQAGMYGGVQISVPASPVPMNLPASCLAGESLNGKSTIFVVRDGRVQRLTVRTGRNDGQRVELLSGLFRQDQVVLDPDDSLQDDARAEAVPFSGGDDSLPEGYATALVR